MRDLVIAGTGNSRFLKSNIGENETWEQAKAKLRAGTFPIDFNGVNADGISQEGTNLNKFSILKDETARKFGADLTDNPDFCVDDTFNKVFNRTHFDIYKLDTELTDWEQLYSNTYTGQNLTFKVSLGNYTNLFSLVKTDSSYEFTVSSNGETVLDIIYENLDEMKTSKYITVGEGFVENTFTDIVNQAFTQGSSVGYVAEKEIPTGVRLIPSIMPYLSIDISSTERDNNNEGYGTIIDFTYDEDNTGRITKMYIYVSELTNDFSIGVQKERV